MMFQFSVNERCITDRHKYCKKKLLLKCILRYRQNGPRIILVLVWRSTHTSRRYLRITIFIFSYTVTTSKLLPQLLMSRDHVSTKCEVPTAFLFRTNRSHGTRRAKLTAASLEEQHNNPIYNQWIRNIRYDRHHKLQKNTKTMIM